MSPYLEKRRLAFGVYQRSGSRMSLLLNLLDHYLPTGLGVPDGLRFYNEALTFTVIRV